MRHFAARCCVSVSLLLVLCFSLRAAPVATTFRFDATSMSPAPKTVNLAGSFNGWSTSATAMNSDGSGKWSVTIPLDEGIHYYKFVADGDKWITDPNGEKELEQDDNYGGKNSGIIVGPDARKFPAAKPNAINAEATVFRADDPADANRFDASGLRLRIRVQQDDVQQVAAIGMTGGDKPVSLQRIGSERGFDIFGGVIELDAWKNPQAGYCFLLQDGTGVGRISADGFVAWTEGPVSKPFAMPDVKFNTPDWARHAVWYQVFPERFRNGDPSNDPGDKEYERLIKWTSDWWKTQPGEADGAENFYKGEGNVWKRRYGGDMQGMKASLPYLRSLGINAIYFNPVFEADSMHKYDTSDYRHIDDNFGVKGDLPIEGETDDPSTWKWSKSDLIFLDFVQEAHRQGFKVVLDGVFNHVGMSHPFFQDVLKNGKQSKYADWFMIIDWGDDANVGNPETYGKPGGIQWRAWDKDNGHLPAFKKDPKLGLAPGPREHVFAITKRWLAPDGDPSRGIDGWRLDVPGDIPHPFWIDWRKVVKQTKPDAYISGEIWTWAQPWLNNGDQFDAVMNYRFATAAQDFFVNQSKAITPSQFNQRLNEMLFNYPLQVSLVQMNLFDSHDTDRLASMFVNPDVAYDAANRLQDNGPNYSAAKPSETDRAKQKLAVAVQMTFVGAPMVYYGNENGMFSPDDPSNRQPMVWKDLEPYDNPDVKFDDALFGFHQRLIALRNKFPSLRTGFFRAVRIDDSKSVFAYARDLHGESVYVVINRSAEPASVSLPIGSDGARVINWLDPSMASMLPMTDAPDSRPGIVPVEGGTFLKNELGAVTIELAPFSAAVLSELR